MRAIEELTAADIMQTAVRTIAAEASLSDASRKLQTHDITALPVLNEHGWCVGILSHTDLEQFDSRSDPHSPYHRLQNLDTDTARVSELMTHRVVSVRTGTPVSDIAQTLSRLRLHHVPVLGETDQLEGYVSASDLP